MWPNGSGELRLQTRQVVALVAVVAVIVLAIGATMGYTFSSQKTSTHRQNINYFLVNRLRDATMTSFLLVWRGREEPDETLRNLGSVFPIADITHLRHLRLVRIVSRQLVQSLVERQRQLIDWSKVESLNRLWRNIHGRLYSSLDQRIKSASATTQYDSFQ